MGFWIYRRDWKIFEKRYYDQVCIFKGLIQLRYEDCIGGVKIGGREMGWEIVQDWIMVVLVEVGEEMIQEENERGIIERIQD